MITPEAAAAAAARALSNLNLDDDPGAAASLRAGHAGSSVFVRRIDVPDRDYYLVPWELGDRVTMVVQVDANSGVMASMAVLKPPIPAIVISPKQSVEVVEETLQESVTGEPEIVWEPARESASPLQPLYRVPIANGHVFVSSDGKVIRTLTPFGRGG
jgi:hypothetical protein